MKQSFHLNGEGTGDAVENYGAHSEKKLKLNASRCCLVFHDFHGSILQNLVGRVCWNKIREGGYAIWRELLAQVTVFVVCLLFEA